MSSPNEPVVAPASRGKSLEVGELIMGRDLPALRKVASRGRAQFLVDYPFAVPAAVARLFCAIWEYSPFLISGVQESPRKSVRSGWFQPPALNMLDWFAQSKKDLPMSDRLLLDGIAQIGALVPDADDVFYKFPESGARRDERDRILSWLRDKASDPLWEPETVSDQVLDEYLVKLRWLRSFTDLSVIGGDLGEVRRLIGDPDRGVRLVPFLPPPRCLTLAQMERVIAFWEGEIFADPRSGEYEDVPEVRDAPAWHEPNAWGPIHSRNTLDALVRWEWGLSPDPGSWRAGQLARFAVWAMHCPFEYAGLDAVKDRRATGDRWDSYATLVADLPKINWGTLVSAPVPGWLHPSDTAQAYGKFFSVRPFSARYGLGARVGFYGGVSDADIGLDVREQVAGQVCMVRNAQLIRGEAMGRSGDPPAKSGQSLEALVGPPAVPVRQVR